MTNKMLTDHEAFGHPAYDSGVRHAASRAFDNKGDCFSVYYDGEAIYVRASEAAPPPNSKLICIAQHWNDKTVQLRFNNAYSEWIDF
jgi:hypothetical protein